VNQEYNGKKRIEQNKHNGEHDQEKAIYLDQKTRETTGKQTTKATSSRLDPKSKETSQTPTHTQEHNGKRAVESIIPLSGMEATPLKWLPAWSKYNTAWASLAANWWMTCH
jgi:hypothetical protein